MDLVKFFILFLALSFNFNHSQEINWISLDEAQEIREQWDRLKGIGEGFIRCCEEGDFTKMEREKNKDQGPRKTLY